MRNIGHFVTLDKRNMYGSPTGNEKRNSDNILRNTLQLGDGHFRLYTNTRINLKLEE